MNEITAAIKKKAEEKYPIEWFGAGLTDYSYHQYKESQEKDQRAYTCGGEDAIVKMKGFAEWTSCWSYRFDPVKEVWNNDNSKDYTTEQLLLKYMEDNKL